MLKSSSALCCIILLILPIHAESQTLSVDLLKMSEMLEARYYIAEKGELPAYLIPLGNVGLYPNFLKTDHDFRAERIEYDAETGLVFAIRVPGQYRFLRREGRRGVFYVYTQRDFSVPGLGLELSTLDEHHNRVRKRVMRQVWVDDVKYSLQQAVDEKPGKGLLSLDIPIKLPKQIERIIGRGEETNLTVQGREKITIGGESRWCANCPQTEGRPREQKFPDLDMEQQLSVDLQGNIGEKINVGIHHSSQGSGMQSTNRVRINYTGFDDDIIKLIEMGDTDLILSGAQLISYSGAAKGLFGVKGMAQMGPLDLTVIASKEEGETATGAFTASGGQATETRIADYDYIKRQFFYLAYPGENYENMMAGSVSFPYPVIEGEPVNDRIELFQSLRKTEWNNTNEAEYSIKAYADPENNGLDDNIDGGDRPWIGRFKNLVQGEDFSVIQLYAEKAKLYVGIELYRRLEDDRALAIMFRGQRCTTCPIDTIGDYGRFREETPNQEDTLTASLICPTSDEFEPGLPTWKMMMRNYYSLGTGQISTEGLTVKIEIEENRPNPDIHVADSSGVSYLRIFGLDRYNRNGDLEPDQLADDLPGILNLARGYLAFPWFEPFNMPEAFLNTYIDRDNPDEGRFDYATLPLSDKIYTETTNLEITKGHLYNIVVEASSGQRTFQLNAFDIIDGSEVVTVDGERLSRGTDYDIDYMSGTVTLKGDKLIEMTPDSRVSIDYQHKPLVGGGKSSLLGIGANLNLSKNSRINGTFLYNSEGAPKYNPRLGEEPSRTMAFDVNGNLQFNPSWMTSLMNLFPRVDTDNQSSLNVNAEVAVSIPNPNVKGEAYIDDMEGIEDSETMGLIRKSWYESSPPLDPLNPEVTLPSMSAGGMEFYWYNPARTPQQEYLVSSKRDLNPRLDERENSAVSSIFLKAYDPGPGDWGGVMTGFPGGGIDLTTVQYLEIWVNDFDADPFDRGGTLHIDFGKIDEDFHQPDSNRFDDEDLPPYTWTAEEDYGFKGDDQKKQYPGVLEASTWDEERQIYKWINSRILNGVHDTEDLNRNGLLNETNAYYSLELNLADSALIDVRRDFPESEYYDYYNEEAINKDRAWRMYRIDLGKMALLPSDATPPRKDAIQHMRIWVENIDSLSGARGHVVEITGLKFVGNRWENDGIRDLDGELNAMPPVDMKVKVGMINNKDNPTLYQSPYSVESEEGIQNREQALLFEFENFDTMSAFRVVKRFFGDGQNYQQYRQMQFFVRGKDIAGEDSCTFFLQIAYDSLNYYEIEVPIEKSSVWYLVSVDFSDLTNLKINAADEVIERTITDAIDPSRTYTARLRGSPTLFKVRYFYSGVRNRSHSVIPAGAVWFNDIKLGGVRRDIDHAERTSFGANFANILQFNGSWQRTGPEFHSLRQKRGSGVTTRSLAMSTKSKVNHFIPTLGFELPVTYKYSSSKSLPKYIPNSDVEIADEAIQDSLKSINNSYTVSVSMSRRGSNNWLMKTFFDNLKTSFSYSKRSIFTPNKRDTSWTMSGNLNYHVTFRRDRQLGLLRGIKWRYWLSNLNFTSSGSRKETESYSRSADGFTRRSTYQAGLNTNMSTLYEPFESIKIDFNMKQQRDLAPNQNWYGLPVGIQTDFSHNMRLNFQPKSDFFLIGQFNPRFEYASRYHDDIRPNIRQGDDPFGTRDASAQRNMSFVFDFDIGRYVTAIGRKVKVLGEGEGGAGGKRRRSSKPSSSESRQQDFKAMLEESRKPKSSEKAGKVESILGDKSPPGVQEEGQPPPATPPPAAPETGAEKETGKGALDDFGAKRHQGADIEPGKGKEEEKEKAAGTDSSKTRTGDPRLLARHMVLLLGRIDPIRATVKLDHQSNYRRLYHRAGLAYQLGFSDEANVTGKSGEIENEPERASNNIIIDLRTGVALTSNIDVDIKASITKRKDEFEGSVSESERLTWPSLYFSISGMERIALLSKFVKQSDLKVNFERKTSSSIKSDEIEYALTPNWNLIWKNSLSTNLSFSYRRTKTTSNRQEMWQQTWAVNFNMRYNFEGTKGFGLPLPFLNKKKLKFKSTLSTDLSMGYSSTSRYNQPAANTLSIAPRASYRFSNKIKGSLSMNYSRTSGGIYGYINHTVGVHVTAEFTF